MSSSESSSASGGGPPDAEPSQTEQQTMPQLDTLISHLVAAKRSLSSINHVWRANEIVTTARAALEESVVVSARTGFLRRGLNNQLRLLYSVRTEVEEISLRGRSEFAAVLKDLDAADARLRRTLELLRETIVHGGFRPEGEQPRSLHDFVDERGVEELHAALKNSIDRTNGAQAQLDSSNHAFDDELLSIKEALGNYRAVAKLASSRSSSSPSSSSASNSSLPSMSSMPSMLHSLEMHAQEMANLLESLVRHFDLCVTAVKHTEGGGAAAKSITGDMHVGVNASGRIGPNIEEGINANLNAPLDPLSDSEYREMVHVLIKDATEAEDVVMEIHDRIGEMESSLENVLAQRDALRSIYNATIDVFQHLSSLASTRLPGYIAQAHDFTRVWHEENDRIAGGLDDLAHLNSFYDGFLDAYDGLIIEVARRRHVRQRVEKVLRDAKHKLDQLYEEDVNAREAFRVEKGDYLPSDIWPEVGREPMRIEFRRILGGKVKGAVSEQANDEEPTAGEREQRGGGQENHLSAVGDNTEVDEVIPELPRDLVEQVFARIQTRVKSTT
ncbi:autophagy-related protein 17 [Aspergillus clavatus NRRL 1]|uniref:Autophagy-related protein 17 n=1 Tax=Aspergillus clavatus (strain ATCC 1007 / CBS 513.65 / DSM 816 / NCTC 3887 / NRRL 1 / QM 1276 / 107) TaxID=344612 RepID=ATG17_ASPCL|nr:kinase activator (Atg17), putative [Aspergillus clavatus NRRL 1]A1C7E5.1 RecName: Full=Autophagy-related protein 17 [Aspergillus clavatus NRRL 1]EAW14316.1 kinase activator (Atg17), putative [Aspergillus clavatus NRRL 1]